MIPNPAPPGAPAPPPPPGPPGPPPSPHPASIARFGAGVLAVVAAITLGAAVADAFPTTVEPSNALPAEQQEDADEIGAGIASALSRLQVELPFVAPAPGDPLTPTPEVRLGVLALPSLEVSQAFYEGVTLPALDRGPGHWPGTALPGELGNVVIAGYRTAGSHPFADLDLLQPGDQLIFTTPDGEQSVYELDDVEVVGAQAIEIVDQGYAYRATLFAPHPRGSVDERIVAHFTLVGGRPGSASGGSTTTSTSTSTSTSSSSSTTTTEPGTTQPPATSPPDTSPPATSPPDTSPPDTSPPVTIPIDPTRPGNGGAQSPIPIGPTRPG